MESAVSRMSEISSAASCSMPRRSFERRAEIVCGLVLNRFPPAYAPGLSRIQTSSAPSVSRNMTLMTSRDAVGTLLPT